MWRLVYRGRHQSSHFNSQQQSGEAYFPTCPTFPFGEIQNWFRCELNIDAKKSTCHCMHTPIYDIYRVESIAFWTKKKKKTYYLTFFVCLFVFFAFALLLRGSRNLGKTAVLVASPHPPPRKSKSKIHLVFLVLLWQQVLNQGQGMKNVVSERTS